MNENMPVISYAAHEGDMTRLCMIIRRMILINIISFILIVISNALWLHAWMQYDYLSTESTTSTSTSTVTVDGKDGVANYIGNDGDINNGESGGAESDNANKNKNKNEIESDLKGK